MRRDKITRLGNYLDESSWWDIYMEVAVPLIYMVVAATGFYNIFPSLGGVADIILYLIGLGCSIPVATSMHAFNRITRDDSIKCVEKEELEGSSVEVRLEPREPLLEEDDLLVDLKPGDDWL